MKKNGWSAIWRQKQYVIAGTLVILAAIGVTVFYGTRAEDEREQMEAEIAEEIRNQVQEEVAVEESSEEAAIVSAVIPPKAADTRTTDIADIPDPDSAVENIESDLEDFEQVAGLPEESEQENPEEVKTVETAATKKTTTTLHFSPEDGMIWPIEEGKVILDYSMDATTYFKTLEQYKCNPAVIIGGEVNSKVYSVAKGRVTSIVNDEVTGTTMTVDLGDGYEAIYGQLKELNFKEGDYVESGHVLGFVSEPTKYFSVEGSNLYFELRKDGEPMNPVEFFQ